MARAERPIFLKTVLLIIVVLGVESVVAILLNTSPPRFSGFSIADLAEVYAKVYPSSKIFLYIQWAVILVIVFLVFLKNRGIRTRIKEKKGIDVKSVRVKSKTDLDALYSILQEKKQLSVKSISVLFNIKEDLAMEWARILESGSLVKIDYPGFGSPVVNVNEKEDNPLMSSINKTEDIEKKKKGVPAKAPIRGVKSGEEALKKTENKALLQKKTKVVFQHSVPVTKKSSLTKVIEKRQTLEKKTNSKRTTKRKTPKKKTIRRKKKK